jgi:hypothetical protein
LVYANDIALESINPRPRKAFKTGAIIVRAKLAQPDSKTPLLLAAMIKREHGFNPAAKDWEFLVLDGRGTKIRQRLKKGVCYECHRTQPDFVFSDSELK